MSEGSRLKAVHSPAAAAGAAEVDEALEKIKANPLKRAEIIQLFNEEHGGEEGAKLKAKVEALFLNPEAQPSVETPKAALSGLDMSAPYEVARRFLLDRHCVHQVPTLRWWCGEWRKWTGTHY